LCVEKEKKMSKILFNDFQKARIELIFHNFRIWTNLDFLLNRYSER
jgi:hypothetical protein